MNNIVNIYAHVSYMGIILLYTTIYKLKLLTIAFKNHYNKVANIVNPT